MVFEGREECGEGGGVDLMDEGIFGSIEEHVWRT